MNQKQNNQRYKTRKKKKKSKKKYKNCNRRRNKKIQSGGSVELDDIKSIIKSGKVYGLFQYGELKDERGKDRFRMRVYVSGDDVAGETVPNKLRLSFDEEHVEYDLIQQFPGPGEGDGGTFVLKLVDLEGNATNTSLKYVDDEIIFIWKDLLPKYFIG